MSKKFTFLYTIFSSLVFIFSILFFSYNIYKDYKTGSNTAGEKYLSLGTDINNIVNKENYSLKTLVNARINRTEEEIAYVSITIDDNLSYVYPSGQSVTNSRFIKEFNTEFDSLSGHIKLKICIFTLKPSSVAYYAKLSFLMVLIITLITIILIIYTTVAEAKAKSEVISETIEDDNIDNSDLDDSIYETDDEEIIDESDFIPEETPFELMDNETSVDSSEVEDSSEEPVIETEEIEEEVKLPYEEYTPVEVSEEPTGLYNPETGLGWESYLNNRLNNEIERAIGSEFDLALFVIETPAIEKDTEIYSNICSYLTMQFQFKDLLFEYKENCIVAIKVNMDVDSALTFSDKLYADLKNLLEDKECFIGISTRSIRMVTGDRLLLEAEEALKHAKEDKTSVVAFRVDIDKYREYMEKNQN